MDPDVSVAAADLQTLYDARMRVYGQQLAIQQLVGRLDEAKDAGPLGAQPKDQGSRPGHRGAGGPRPALRIAGANRR